MNHLPLVILVDAEEVVVHNAKASQTPTGGQAVTAQLIVVSIWAAGKGTMAASVLAYPLQL